MKRSFATRYAVALTVAGTLFGTPSVVLAANYTIDPAHSFVQFRIKHLGYSWLVGRFNDVKGSFTWDESKPTDSVINATVDTTTVDTNHAKRDKHLRSEDFLEVAKFPSASFASKSYAGNADSGTLTGDLTILGVTKEVSIPVTRIGQGDDPWGGYRAGFEGKLDLTRADYGDKYKLGPASEALQLELLVEGIRDK